MAQAKPNLLLYNVLQKLTSGRNLSRRLAHQFFGSLFDESIDAGSARSVLALLARKGESADELWTLATFLRKRGRRAGRFESRYLVDNCGTGGDQSGTFNISTTAAFVAAGAGAFVAKHGNRSVSSQAGSSDLMEALGVNIAASPAQMIKALRHAHIGYFHAPLYQPLLKKVHGIRRSLGMRTIFNFVGPLVNPVGVRNQLIGVSVKEKRLLLGSVLKRLGARHALVVHGSPGIDEVATTGPTEVCEVKSGRLRQFQFDPRRVGMKRSQLSELRGGDVRENKRITWGILKGTLEGPKRDAVLLNAAFTLYASDLVTSIEEGLSLARRSLDGGRALRCLKGLIELSRRKPR